MLNVLIPCAGEGKRFKDAGYADPKPLIPIKGRPMIEWVVDAIPYAIDHRLIFCVNDQDQEVYQHLKKTYPNSVIQLIMCPTAGAACTCLGAEDFINGKDPLLIMNCDQIVRPDAVRYLVEEERPNANVLTMPSDGSKKWSYVEINSGGDVVRVAEKIPISDRATCGLYWWAEGRYFITSTKAMLAADDRTNGEFYVAPSLNYLPRHYIIEETRSEEYGGFVGLGTPEDVKKFEGG